MLQKLKCNAKHWQQHWEKGARPVYPERTKIHILEERKMEKNKKEVSRYHIGGNLLIGKRNDESLFWLKTEGENHGFSDGWKDLNVKEGGTAWFDEDTDTTIIGFPTKTPGDLSNMKVEYVENGGFMSDYTQSEYYVHLSDCELLEVVSTEKNEADRQRENSVENAEKEIGYILEDQTFVRKDKKTGDLFYLQFMDFTNEELEEDRYGWVQALKRLEPGFTKKMLFDDLQGGTFTKESRGRAWVDSENGILVLAPAYDVRPEVRDNYFVDGLIHYHEIYSKWDQTQHWISADTKLQRNPVNWKMQYLAMNIKYMG